MAESCPIDAYEGALGIDHHDVRSRIRNVQAVRAVHPPRSVRACTPSTRVRMCPLNKAAGAHACCASRAACAPPATRCIVQDLALWKIAEAIRDGELELELSDHGLDTLPEELFDLSWLQIIDLSKNFFVTSVFEQLAYLPNLRTLDLSTNLLNGPMPEAVGRLSPALEELSIDENVLTALHPAAASLSQLVWLSARRNLLTEIPPPCLSAWNKLEYLDLRNNKLTSLPVEIGACISLQSLFLSENELTSLPDSFDILDPSFCSLGQTLEYYRRIKLEFPTSYVEILQKLGDAVFTIGKVEKFQ
ncbi:MAG: leucine-rich repeat domain-containing protein, partial [Methanosarcinales archaeon]